METIIHKIEYDGKDYIIEEPTLDMWSKLISVKDFDSEFELALRLLQMATGLEYDELRKASSRSVYGAADGLIDYYTTQDNKFVESFTFNDKKYKFVELGNLSFGEFVDIDDQMTKPEVERMKNLHLLMALLYREIDDDGNFMDYDTKRITGTAEEFRQLPIKYLNGALFFFYVIELILQKNIQFSLTTIQWWKWRIYQMVKILKMPLDGIQSLLRSLKNVYLIFQKWFKSTILRH